MNRFNVLLLSLLVLFTGQTLAVEQVTYYHHDLSGSPLAATDDTGTLLWEQAYDPWGVTLLPQSDPRVFTGAPQDTDTALVDMQARWYSPDIGRMLAQDPPGFREDNLYSFNLYAYGNNNPYRYVDPNGEIPLETAWDLANIGIGVASLGRNLYEGNWGSAAVDLGGIIIDGAATALPYVPGGAGTAIKSSRAVDAVGDVVQGGDNFVDGYRAVSKAEVDDIAKNGFRPDPNGNSMQDKWFSESRSGAEKFKQNYSDLDEIVETKVPKDVYDRSYKHPNIDNTGPGFCVSCDDLHRLE